jgi:hypothetical protein
MPTNLNLTNIPDQIGKIGQADIGMNNANPTIPELPQSPKEKAIQKNAEYDIQAAPPIVTSPDTFRAATAESADLMTPTTYLYDWFDAPEAQRGPLLSIEELNQKFPLNGISWKEADYESDARVSYNIMNQRASADRLAALPTETKAKELQRFGVGAISQMTDPINLMINLGTGLSSGSLTAGLGYGFVKTVGVNLAENVIGNAAIAPLEYASRSRTESYEFGQAAEEALLNSVIGTGMFEGARGMFKVGGLAKVSYMKRSAAAAADSIAKDIENPDVLIREKAKEKIEVHKAYIPDSDDGIHGYMHTEETGSDVALGHPSTYFG